MTKELEEAIKEALLKEKRSLFTFLTGAGISSDSGIPTYRGSDGIWVKGTKFYRPEEFATMAHFERYPEEVWQYVLFRKRQFEMAQPNESHKAIVEIEDLLQNRFHLITQNIDNLHLRAGSKRMYEIHGNNREVKCSKGCPEILPLPEILKGKELEEGLTIEEIDALKCDQCGGWLRPNVLMFDEYYDERTNKHNSSLKVAKNTGILFIVGTSGATNLPMEIMRTALKFGAFVVDINLQDNQFSEVLKDKKRAFVVREGTGTALPRIKEIIRTVN